MTITTTTGGAANQTGETEVKGVLVGDPAGAHDQAAVQPGAPGLHSAGAGGNQTPWLAIAIGGTAVLLAFAGSQLERRRPQVIL